METYSAEHKRYQEWLQSMREQGKTVTTRTKAFFKDMFDRRRYNGPLPDGVEEGRRLNDSLHKIEQDLEKIKKNTEETNSFFGSLFSGLGQMVAERKARKK